MENVRLVADGLEFPEGPVAMADGSVVLVEIKRGTVTRVDPSGKKEVVAEPGGGPNGAAIGPDGALYVCNNGGFEWNEFAGLTVPGHQPEDYIGGRIQRVDLESGKVEDLYTEVDGHPLRGPNDLVFDTEGGFWFSDHGKTRPRDRDQGGIYYAKADGSSITEVIHPVDGPNGIGLSPGGDVLYYAETHSGRIWQRRLASPGVLENPGGFDPSALLAGLPGMQLLDSLGVDSEGNVCVATIVNAGITIASPSGEVTHDPMPPEFSDLLVTNICWGGDDMKTAYITLSGTGRLVAADWPTAGLKLAY